MILTWYENTFQCAKAVKTDNQIDMYDAENNHINSIVNISFDDWQHISIDGDWSEPLPTIEERNRADIDYIALMSDIDLGV